MILKMLTCNVIKLHFSTFFDDNMNNCQFDHYIISYICFVGFTIGSSNYQFAPSYFHNNCTVNEKLQSMAIMFPVNGHSWQTWTCFTDSNSPKY